MSESQIKKISEIYYNPEIGLSSAKNIYDKLDKKITLKIIKEVLDKFKNKQIKKVEEKIYIPIIGDKNTYQLDLTFFEQYKRVNAGYGILMTIININTKFAYIYPLKDKKTASIIKAFKKFISECKNIDTLEGDLGSEWNSREFKNLCEKSNIKLILFNKKDSPNALSIIERFNRTIRTMIDDYMIAYNTKKYYNILPKLINNYNNRTHSTIGDKPININEEKEEEIIKDKKLEYFDVKQKINEEFNITDKVRLLKIRKLFNKGQKETYSKKIYEIIGKEDNKFIVKSGIIIKSVLPYTMKQIDSDIIQNPFLEDNNKKEKEKDILQKDKVEKKQKRKIKKEGLDINPNKIRKLNVRELRPQGKINYF